MEFKIKHFNTTLMLIDLRQEGLSGLQCAILEKAANAEALFPIGFRPDEEGVKSWLRTRVIPQNRGYVDKILAGIGLTHNDIVGIIKISMGLSLNDCYWVTPADFEGKFEDYNLFEHDFVKALSLVAYTGYGSVKVKGFTSSPEFTTNGMLRKGWRRLDGQILLYKGGTEGAANSGLEPYSEFYASQIAEAMGLNHVPYKLASWKKAVCSVCPLFTDIETAYVPMWRFGNFNTIPEIIAYLDELGPEYTDAFRDMLVFDALICNTDRHQNNFGLLVNSRTNEPVAFAPIFDNGLGLFPYAMQDDLNDIARYAETRISAFDVGFIEIAKGVITSRQKAQLRKMIGFAFSRGNSYYLPAKRLAAIEKWLQSRVHAMLEM